MCLLGEPERAHVTECSSYWETDLSQNPLVTKGPNPQRMVLSGVLGLGGGTVQSLCLPEPLGAPLVQCTVLSIAKVFRWPFCVSITYNPCSQQFVISVKSLTTHFSMFISESSLHPPFARLTRLPAFHLSCFPLRPGGISAHFLSKLFIYAILHLHCFSPRPCGVSLFIWTPFPSHSLGFLS